MIESIGSETKFNTVSNTNNAVSEELKLGFAELLADKIVSSEKPVSVTIAAPGAHGYVGDGQVFIPPELIGVPADALNDVIDVLMSLTDDLENIWDIVLRLEEKVDIEAFSENIDTDLDNSAGLSFIAALLTRFWKKKELSGDNVSENSADISAYYDPNYTENKVASELEALILKNKERKLITAV